MTGSLLQIVSTDIKDVFLTIDPQITFFKIVYLRHTPFAIDLLEEKFNTTPNFGEDGFCALSKNGDLISNIFLKIELPSVQISNIIDSDKIISYNNSNIKSINMTATQYIDYLDNLITKFKIFSSIAMIYWREINSLYKNITSNYTTIINYIINKNNNKDDNQNKYNQYNEFNNLNITNYNYNFNFDILNYIQNNFTNFKNASYNTDLNTEYKYNLSLYLSDYLFFQNKFLKFLLDTKNKYNIIKEKASTTFYNFSWVNKIGFALINNIIIEIGGQEIDRVTNNILNDWYELSQTQEKTDILNKMIGNIDILTNYDSTEKPLYTLLIPLPFWFCKYKAQALPCVGLKYNDILIKVKLNELNKCCYFEPNEHNKYISKININELIQIQNISLLVEYIHLGDDERKKFGSFTNEILIEQHKEILFENIITNNILLPLDFVNPVREIIWTIQKSSCINDLKLWNNFDTNNFLRAIINVHDINNNIEINLNSDNFKYTINPLIYQDGYIEIFHSKFYNGIYKIISQSSNVLIINNTNFIYPDNIKIKLFNKYMQSLPYIISETIQIYGNDLLSKRDPIYFTNVQPYQNHSTISNNIHNYSFCLNSEIFQPTGSLNFSIIDTKNLYLEFDKNVLLEINNNNDNFIVKIIARSHNLLSIENGMGKVKFGI